MLKNLPVVFHSHCEVMQGDWKRKNDFISFNAMMFEEILQSDRASENVYFIS